ncbi:DUF6442 family protein [Candidatus Soleaferrea massiliensis]|uniref:DUF6442 family protein n=1 Tax=Candidatus Soleaferrea massiliensis TaxID=1470354 RepID=UPI00058B44EB|nr:DUF6442 family protein [Candidatus Soleaferrea massiliensis]
MRKGTVHLLTAAAGVVLLGVGLLLIKTLVNPQGILLALPYICVGIGCGAFGQGMGSFLSYRAMKNHPAVQRRLEIEQHDERNVAISNRAKARAYDRMTFVFGALMLCFALMGIDMVAVLLLVFAYLFVQGCGIYYRCKYEKEM